MGGIVGVIHRVPAKIELPPQLKHLVEPATPDKLTLEALHRRITRELLLMGRYGLLADVPEDGGEVYLAGYDAEHIINLSDWYHDLYVLDESRLRREGFAWVQHWRYRVLQLIDGAYQQQVFEYGSDKSIPAVVNGTGATAGGVPVVNVSTIPNAPPQGDPVSRNQPTAEATFQLTQSYSPTKLGNKPIDTLPMVVIGSRDLTDTPDEPPLLDVARAAIAIYRLDADYRA